LFDKRIEVQEIKRIGIIGSGNVATNLTVKFKNSGIEVAQVFTRNRKSLNTFITGCQPSVITDIKLFDSSLDLIIIATPDDSIEQIAKEILTKIPVVHTSGSVAIANLKNRSNYGSFYPLQTLTTDHAGKSIPIPILIEASNPTFEAKLIKLAETISTMVSVHSSENRKKLHLAAVVVNNFTNHLYSEAEQYCIESGISFNLLKPLLKETARKVQTQSAGSIQTGPAKRKDMNIIEGHLNMLSENKDLRDLYQLISAQILKKSIK